MREQFVLISIAFAVSPCGAVAGRYPADVYTPRVMQTDAWVWFDFAGDVATLERLLAELDGAGACGGEERETAGAAGLRMYWPADRVDAALRARVADACQVTGARLAEAGDCPRADWLAEWKRHFAPVRASRRIWVCPPWNVCAPSDESVCVVIEPQMAFGTGTHPTTQMCLQMLDEAVRPGDTVLDVGCGSAVLAIAAARLGAARVLAVDCDAEAVPNAMANVRRNGVDDRVRVECADFGVDPVSPEWTHVVCNINTAGLVPLLPRLARTVAGGAVLLSGVGREHRDEVVAALAGAGLVLEGESASAEWCAFCCFPAESAL